jgi:hypothetical protein
MDPGYFIAEVSIVQAVGVYRVGAELLLDPGLCRVICPISRCVFKTQPG